MDRNGRKKKKRQEQEGETERVGMRERLCRSLDLAPDLLPGGSVIEVRDRHLLTLHGGGKILRYTPEEVCVAVRKGYLSVKGRRLFCNSYHIGAVCIEGEIDSLSFERAEECE